MEKREDNFIDSTLIFQSWFEKNNFYNFVLVFRHVILGRNFYLLLEVRNNTKKIYFFIFASIFFFKF